MDRNIQDFTIDEINALLDSNLKFRDHVAMECYERICENLQYGALRSFPGHIEYGCVYCMTCDLSESMFYGTDWDAVLEWLESVSRDGELFFEDDLIGDAKYAKMMNSHMDDIENDAEYRTMEQKIQDIKEKIEHGIIRAVDAEIDQPDDIDYLKGECEIWLDCGYFDNYYLDEDGKVYQLNKHYI